VTRQSEGVGVSVVSRPAVARVLIDGEDLDTPTAPVINPARVTEVVGSYALGTARHVDLAARAAAAAFPAWSALPAAARGEQLLRAAQEMAGHVPGWAQTLTREVGKVLPESSGDAAGAVSLTRYFASLAAEVDAERPVQLPLAGRGVLRHVPSGPAGIISPWNTPIYLTFLAVAPALIAGDTVVVKPPEDAPLAATSALSVLARALPPGVVNIVPGRGGEAGAALAAHPAVRKILFTGSVETGKRVLRAAADTVKNVGMELGGNDAALVLRDAPIGPQLIRELTAGVFGLSGQVCYGVKRIYVDAGRLAEFTAAFTEMASRIVVGDGLDPRSTIGPVATRAGYDKVLALRAASEAAGAQVRVVGTKLDPEGWEEGYFVLPTVVTGLAADAPLVTAEQFGPIIPILPFADEDEAVRLANDTEFGLGASVWSADTERAWRLARRIDAGSVFVNVHRVGASPMSLPFGGFKRSGVGRNHGLESVFACMEQQAVVEFDDPGAIPGTDHWNAHLG
jgi:aldehyde dehydrogenase